jgi:hypothetical protein
MNEERDVVAFDGQKRTKTRILSIEVLRIVAMLGIAVFHTFQPWFEFACTGLAIPESLLWRPSMLGILGTIDQLGAWGNHFFIMISGCFLLPSAVRNATAGKSGARGVAHRVGRAFLVIVPYVAIALAVGAMAPDITSASMYSFGWLTQGLQFIWVYLILVALTPCLGKALVRMKHPDSALAVATVAVYAVNYYIAFVSPGDTWRSLFEWRKLMSGITYGLSFVIGGWLAHRRLSRVHASSLLCVSIAATILVETYAARRVDLTLLNALSYKSTSIFSCAMAVGCLALALALPTGTNEQNPRLSRVITSITSGMLGFYVLQALFSKGWHQVSYDLLYVVLKQHGQLAFITAGVLFSLLFFVTLDMVDIFVRQPLVRRWLHDQ